MAQYHCAAQDIPALRALLASLVSASNQIEQKINASAQVLAKNEFPLQVDNVVAQGGFNSSVLGHFRIELSSELGFGIEGEKTQLHARILHLPEGSADDDDLWGDDWDWGNGPNNPYSAKFYWQGTLVKEISGQTLPKGATLGFDFATEGVEPDDLNEFVAELSSWKNVGHGHFQIGSKLAELHSLLPVASDGVSPAWLSGSSPDAAHSYVKSAQSVSAQLKDSFGLIDPAPLQATLMGTLTSGAVLNQNISSKLAVLPRMGAKLRRQRGAEPTSRWILYAFAQCAGLGRKCRPTQTR